MSYQPPLYVDGTAYAVLPQIVGLDDCEQLASLPFPPGPYCESQTSCACIPFVIEREQA